LGRLQWGGTMKKSKPYEEFLDEYLADPADAVEYLNTAMEDEDPRVFLLALKHIAKAREGGVTKVCQTANLNRESLYKTLKNSGPRFENLKALIQALGFKLVLEIPETKPGKTADI
jgi:probable addiction module antidote protein